MFGWLRDYFWRCRRNWAIMRAAVDSVGAELESLSNDDLKELLANDTAAHEFEREFEGHRLRFTLQECDLDRKSEGFGYYVVCNGLATLGGIKPSYQFSKKLDLQ
jgi:hypothetical protein